MNDSHLEEMNTLEPKSEQENELISDKDSDTTPDQGVKEGEDK